MAKNLRTNQADLKIVVLIKKIKCAEKEDVLIMYIVKLLPISGKVLRNIFISLGDWS